MPTENIHVTGLGTQVQAEPAVRNHNSGHRSRRRYQPRAFWTGAWGMLFGLTVFLLPAMSALVLAGPLTAVMVGALQSVAMVLVLMAFGARLHNVVKDDQ